MPDQVLHHTLQEYGTGAEIALALTQYGGKVLQSYYNKLTVGRHAWVHPITQGKTYQFPATAQATADELTPGSAREGSNQPEIEERLVVLNSKPIISDHYEGEIDAFIRHYDTRKATGRADGLACRLRVERELFAALALGARQAARGTGDDAFAGGLQVTGTYNDLGNEYPRSLTGSQTLQDQMSQVAVRFDENNVDDEGRICFLSPYLYDVLIEDNKLTSHDYTDINDLVTRRMIECKGFKVEKTNLIKHTSTASATCVLGDMSSWSQSAYQGSFLKTAALFIGDQEAVGQITAYDLKTFGPEWMINYHSWYFGAKIWHGAKWLRPESCAEIILGSS